MQPWQREAQGGSGWGQEGARGGLVGSRGRVNKGELTRLLKQIAEAKPGFKKENRKRGEGRKEDPRHGVRAKVEL